MWDEWLLDKILNGVVYLARTGIRLIKERLGRAWLVTEGTVVKTYGPEASYSKVEVVYTYQVKGKLYTGMYPRAFFSKSAADDYANRFQPGQRLVVHYKPEEPMKSAAW